MIQVLRVGTVVVLRLKCDDCGELAPPIPATSADEDEWGFEASRAMRPHGWTEVRRTAGGRHLAAICPKCGGVKPAVPQLALDLGGRKA